MIALELITTLGGLIFPPAMDFIKKKFLKPGSDTPEATMSSLATTKPEVLPEYVNAVVGLKKAEIDYFNRDVVGAPSQWVVDLRAAIRPIGVVLSFALLATQVCLAFYYKDISMLEDPVWTGVRMSSEVVISSWFGDRIRLK